MEYRSGNLSAWGVSAIFFHRGDEYYLFGCATMRSLLFQPDYYFGTPQFAGVAVALSNGLYQCAGIVLRVLPLGDAGAHAAETRVVDACNENGGALTVGTTEQNILIPAIEEDCD